MHVDKICLAVVCVLAVVLIGTSLGLHCRGSGWAFLGFIGVCGAALAGLATLEAPPDNNTNNNYKFDGGGRGDRRGQDMKGINKTEDDDDEEKYEGRLHVPNVLVTISDALKAGPIHSITDPTKRNVVEETLRGLVSGATTMVEYDDIKHRTPYAGKSDPKADKGLRRAVHNGQLKLFLTELQFLTMYLKTNNDPCYVVYAGSAPSHKLGMLMALFPKTKFVLIDPAEHLIEYLAESGVRETQYSPNRINAQLYFSATDDDKFRKRIGNGVERQINLYRKGLVSRDSNKGLNAMPTSSDELVRVIRDSAQQVYIIESIMTVEIAELLAPLGAGSEGPLLFVSDIRTNQGKDAPSNVDIIWNSAQHLNWLRRLRPAHYILKFHPPYPEAEKQRDKGLQEYAVRQETHDDVSNCKDMVDFLENYKAGRFVYLKGDHIFIQAFAPLNSTEVRLVGSNTEEMVEYDMIEFEERMRYYNVFHRPLGNHEEMRGYENQGLGIDRCGDCAIAGHIFKEYLQKYKGSASSSTVAALFQKVLVSIRRDLFSVDNMHGKDNIHTALLPGKAFGIEDAVDHLCEGHALCKITHGQRWSAVTTDTLLQWAEMRARGVWGFRKKALMAEDMAEELMDSVMKSVMMGILFGWGQQDAGGYHMNVMMEKLAKIISRSDVVEFKKLVGSAINGKLQISPQLGHRYSGSNVDDIFTAVFSRGSGLVRSHCRVDAAIAETAAAAGRIDQPARLVEVSMVGQGYYTSRAASVLPMGLTAYEQRSILGPGQTLICNEKYDANTVILIYLLGVPSAAATLIGELIRKVNPRSLIITINHEQGRIPGPEFAPKLDCSCGNSCRDMFMLTSAPARN